MLLCHFNPDHDYALANGDENFVAPASARDFAHDCRGMLSLAFPGSVTEWNPSVTEVQVWGWNPSVRKTLNRQGVPMELMPSDIELAAIRELAHRRASNYAMNWLSERLPNVPIPPVILTSIEQADALLARTDNAVILKWPYSSNGTGIVLVPQDQVCNWLTLPAREQCAKQICRFGSVMLEPYYDVVQNFAMEFECRDGHSEFCGYSLFQTDRFSYSCNLLMSDAEIERQLSMYVPVPRLQEIAHEMAGFLNVYASARYSGIVGVDMFVYRENGAYHVNPAVELNFRHTMGWLARRLYDNGVVPPGMKKMRVSRRDSHYCLVFEK